MRPRGWLKHALFAIRRALCAIRRCLAPNDEDGVALANGCVSPRAEELAFPKVQLHLHLDGAVRHATILELAKQKRIDLRGATTVEELKRLLVTHEPSNLVKVLSAFAIYLPCLIGDAEAIERIAYELCEDQARCNVVYFEARYSPHGLSSSVDHSFLGFDGAMIRAEKGILTPTGVVEAVNRGLARGCAAFGTRCGSILCCIQQHPVWNDELLELAVQFRDKGVVGIDVAGAAHGSGEQYEQSVIDVFQRAEALGIHRTAHAGESAGPQSVADAVEKLKATRIGHGYRMLWDEAVYTKYALPGVVHFEGCPLSSIMTGAVANDWDTHPMIRWSRDGVNFSISTDDPTCFDNDMTSEMMTAAHEIRLPLEQLKQCQLNAARAAFLPDDDKALLVERLQQAFQYQLGASS